MHKERSRKNVAQPTPKRFSVAGASWAVKIGQAALLLLVASAGFFASRPQSAQQRYREQPVKVTGIASSGGSYTITADGPLTRAQTFQTDGWFHVVVVNGQTDLGGGAPGGVRLQRISDSLEIRIPVKPGASVTVNPRGSRLDLVVEGGTVVAEGRGERAVAQEAASSQQAAEREQARREAAAARAEREAARRAARAEQQLALESTQPTKRPQAADATAANAAATAGNAPAAGASASAPAGQDSDVLPIEVAARAGGQQDAGAQPPPPAQSLQSEAGGGGLLGAVFSATALIVLLVVGVAGGVSFVFMRRRKSVEGNAGSSPAKGARETAAKARGEEKSDAKADAEGASLPTFEQSKGDRRKESVPVSQERRVTGRGAEDEATRQQRKPGEADSSSDGGERKSEARASLPSVVFGAYRIEQEVTQLVRGGPHSIEVLASRAVDDRRAVETFLMKALNSPETDEDGRRRVRTAFEDYGFVARQNATLLLAGNSYERTAAAHTLGEMRSPQALPFLTEALYDADAVVRTEAVKSLGSLGLPSSIGAMLDMARRHPDIPAAVLGPALTACSVETVEAMGGICEEGVPLTQALSAEQFVNEMRGAEAPQVRELPDWLEDETLTDALDRLQSADVEARIVAAQSLARFQVRRAVEALAAMAVRDESSAVRAAAVTALGSIDHESVFAPVLVAMADDSREVRAAAARTMSRLGFERADAYMHVTETADRPTLSEAARACVKSGLAAQAVGRLTSEDRRQAFEAFSVLALVVKGGEAQVILDAVEHHQEIEVRLAAVHVLGLMDDPALASRLEMIARRGGLPVPLHAAIQEVAARASRVRQEVFES